jgi:hypothetical protein
MVDDELARNIPPDVEALILPGFDSTHMNAEAEMAVTEYGCSKLNGCVEYVMIRGVEHGGQEGMGILRRMGALMARGLDVEEALAKATAKAGRPTRTAASKEVSDLAKRLIRGAWSYPYNADRSQRHDFDETMLIIDSDERLYGLLYSLGEDTAEMVREEIKRELLRLEEQMFEKRRKKLGGELDHIRGVIRGKSWDQAKLAIFRMQPGGDRTDREIPDDGLAETLFSRLYGTVKSAGYADVEMLTSRSPYMDRDGKRYLKRLSEVRNHPQEKMDVSNNEDINKYNERNLFLHVFGHDATMPPASIEVYRGVPRADAQLRPGDFVTTNRSYARFYMRGKAGAIIRKVVNTDDLLIMKLEDVDGLEFVYYPRGAMQNPAPSSGEVKPPFTFREFWAEVNGVAP